MAAAAAAAGAAYIASANVFVSHIASDMQMSVRRKLNAMPVVFAGKR